MRDKTIKTGIDVIPDTPWGTHLCLFYQTKEDLIDILVPYFKAGLENNEFCMWVTSEPLSAKDAKRSLQKAVRNLDAYIVKGQIEILDYSQWYTKSGKFETDRVLQGWIEKENQAVKRGFDGLRLTGNTFWLEERDWAAFTEYEATVDQVIGNYRMLAICTYSLDRCGAAKVMDVVSNHQFALVRREGKWEAIESAERKRVEEAERLQRDQLIAHSRILRSILSTQELDELLGLILDEALGLLRVEFGSIHLLQKDGLVLRCWRDFSDELRAHMHFFPATNLPNWTRQPCIVHERLSEHGIIPDFAKRDGIQAWASIPLRLPSPRNVEEGEWLGTVLVGSRHYEALNKEEVRMFQGLADQLVLAIDHARAYRAAHERLARLQILRTIDSAIIQGQDTRLVLRHVVDMIPEGLIADAVAISMLDEEHFRTEVFVMRLPGGVFVEEEAFTLAESLLHWFVERQEPVIIYDLIQDPRVQMHRQRNCIDRLISYLGVPLVVRGRTIGILHILTTQPRIFVDEDIEFFRTMAGQAAIAIANARLFGEVQQELTERKRGEEALRKSEERYRNLVESISDVVYAIDGSGVLTYISPIVKNTLGYEPDELIGKQFLEFVHKEDRDLLMRRFSELREGIVRHSDYRVIGKHGNIKWVRTLTNPIIEEGSFGGARGVLIDITERKRAEEALRESEERYRSLVEAAPDVIYTISAEDGSLTSLNPAFEALTGWSRAEWLGKPFVEIVHPDDLPVAVETFQKASRGETPTRYELRVLSKSGEYLVGEFTSTPLMKGGKVVGELGIARDITERKLAELASKRAEEELKTAKSRLQRLSHRLLEVQENDRRAIARELHDEIGQILTAAKIDLQVIRRGKIPEDLASRLDENIASLDNCLGRVRNLSLDLRPSMLDDLGLVAALRWQLNRQAERAGVEVHLVAEDAPERLHPELETVCYRIVQEALTNIAKHAHAHNVWVELTSSDREVLLSVRDDGVGFHVESALADAAHGASFGILGMQERASLLGGKLEIVSAREKGTTVTARFPLR